MALTLTMSSENSPIGVALPSAYHKIIDFCMPVNSPSVVFGVGIYVDRTASLAGKDFVKRSSYTMENYDHSEDTNIKTKLYTYLKTLSAYTGASDVLEEA